MSSGGMPRRHVATRAMWQGGKKERARGTSDAQGLAYPAGPGR